MIQKEFFNWNNDKGAEFEHYLANNGQITIKDFCEIMNISENEFHAKEEKYKSHRLFARMASIATSALDNLSTGEISFEEAASEIARYFGNMDSKYILIEEHKKEEEKNGI